MKSNCYAAAGLLAASLLLAGPASAQAQGTSDAGADSPHGPGYGAGYEDGLRAAMAHIDSMVQSRDGGEDEMAGHMGHMHKMMEHMGGMQRMGGRGGAGPHVMLLRGNAKIVLKCAASDSTTDCVNAAIVLLNHAAEKEAKAPQQGQPGPAPQPVPAPGPAPMPPASMPPAPMPR